MGLNNAYATKIGVRILQAGSSITAPTGLKIRLWTVKPGVAGTGGTEVTGASYAFVSLAPSSSNWPEVSGQPGRFSNGAAIDFGDIDPGGWGQILAGTIEDQAGVIIATGDLDIDTSLAGTLVFDIGAFVVDINPS